MHGAFGLPCGATGKCNQAHVVAAGVTCFKLFGMLGHAGFNERMKAVPFPVSSFAENVAMNSGLNNVAGVAVNGWIESPGHRKNLLSRSSLCAIGVYRNNSGAWYLTQLFALC